MDYAPFVEGIRATGFPFEHFTAEQLRKHGWQIISNRYYVDDDENKPREIDILAYKAHSFKDFDLRTAVIISCKKSESFHWAFLTREANLKDPNSNWQPFHYHSDYKPLSYQISQDTWESTYHDAARKAGVEDIFSLPKHEVFALQEMANGDGGKKAGVSKGDSSIYSSVLSTIKALLYEKSVRDSKKRKKPTVYQFNLLCLTDGKFLKLHFSGENITPEEIQYIPHIARYISKRQQVFARVCFSTKTYLGRLLADLDRLHEANKSIFTQANEAFFTGVLKNSERRAVLMEDFRNELYWAVLRVPGYIGDGYYAPMKKADLRVSGDGADVFIGVSSEKELDLDKLNTPAVLEAAKGALKKVFRMEARCIFEDEIPF